MALLDAWGRLNESLCICGRPRAVHAEQVEDDYLTGYDECPAIKALDRAQAAISIDDEQASEQARKSGDEITARMTPERPRSWVAWTDAEGAPD